MVDIVVACKFIEFESSIYSNVLVTFLQGGWEMVFSKPKVEGYDVVEIGQLMA